MESALASTGPRLIEYPADLSGCSSLTYKGRNLLYLCSREAGSTPFVVVLGYFSGQKEDIVTKDLIEAVSESSRRGVSDDVSKHLPKDYSNAHIFFL